MIFISIDYEINSEFALQENGEKEEENGGKASEFENSINFNTMDSEEEEVIKLLRIN